MEGSKWRVMPAIVLLGSSLCGCVTMGRPLLASGARTVQLAQGPEIPLVPVPPPPLGQEKTAPLGKAEQSPPVVVPAAPIGEDPPPPAPVERSKTSSSEGGVTPPSRAVPTPQQLYQAAKQRYETIDSYIARLTRREVVKGEANPEEVILFKFRKHPWSVYFKWLGKEGQGREAVYVQGRYESKIHSLLAAGDIPFVPAGRRMSLSPDNILVKSATRHPITEAGIGASITKIGGVLQAVERGDGKQGRVTVLGPLARAEFEKPVYVLEHVIPAGADASLPRGGIRMFYFDPVTSLPVLIVAKDERDQEVEYYRYDRIQAGVKLDDADFDPDRLFAKKTDTNAE